MRILAEVGVNFLGNKALPILRKNGAKVEGFLSAPMVDPLPESVTKELDDMIQIADK